MRYLQDSLWKINSMPHVSEGLSQIPAQDGLQGEIRHVDRDEEKMEISEEDRLHSVAAMIVADHHEGRR